MPLTKIQSLGITDGTIVNADINASAAITGTKLSGVNDAKAWVNFNGSGTIAIRASFNVSSITDNGTGDYTINLTTAMSDANYAVTALTARSESGSQVGAFCGNTQTSSAFGIVELAGSTFYDPTTVHAAIFR